MTEFNESQKEAVAVADAHTQNAGLPTYSALLEVAMQAIAEYEENPDDLEVMDKAVASLRKILPA